MDQPLAQYPHPDVAQVFDRQGTDFQALVTRLASEAQRLVDGGQPLSLLGAGAIALLTMFGRVPTQSASGLIKGVRPQPHQNPTDGSEKPNGLDPSTAPSVESAIEGQETSALGEPAQPTAAPGTDVPKPGASQGSPASTAEPGSTAVPPPAEPTAAEPVASASGSSGAGGGSASTSASPAQPAPAPPPPAIPGDVMAEGPSQDQAARSEAARSISGASSAADGQNRAGTAQDAGRTLGTLPSAPRVAGMTGQVTQAAMGPLSALSHLGTATTSTGGNAAPSAATAPGGGATGSGGPSQGSQTAAAKLASLKSRDNAGLAEDNSEETNEGDRK